jgi:hypothetical protein
MHWEIENKVHWNNIGSNSFGLFGSPEITQRVLKLDIMFKINILKPCTIGTYGF